MTTAHNRVEVLHGVNFDVLERRDPEVYGGLSLSELETKISAWARELDLEAMFFQTNSEGEFVEYLHRLPDLADAALINAGAWTHYSWAIADALEMAGCPPSRSTSPTSSRARTGASSRSSTGWCWRRSRARAPTATARRSRCSPASSGPAPDARPRRPPRRAGRRARARRMLVTDLVNVRYLTGFGGTNGACVCGPERAPLPHRLPLHRAGRGGGRGLGGRHGPGRLAGGVAGRLQGKVGFEDDHLSVRILGKLEESSPTASSWSRRGDGGEAAPGQGRRPSWPRSPRPSELADEVWRWALERGLIGRSERDVARAAEARIRELGGDPSFPAIVAAGPNGALPHAEPGEREIGRGELVVFDMGAKLDGYCSDGTRTFAAGELGEKARGVYEVVREAQAAALAAVGAGVTGEAVDGVAREVIDAAGFGELFGHGLGHGVGLEVHEAPRLSQRSEDVLEPGEVVTVEPGVYIPGELGVRIEDLVVVTADGSRSLSGLPKQLQLVE